MAPGRLQKVMLPRCRGGRAKVTIDFLAYGRKTVSLGFTQLARG